MPEDKTLTVLGSPGSSSFRVAICHAIIFTVAASATTILGVPVVATAFDCDAVSGMVYVGECCVLKAHIRLFVELPEGQQKSQVFMLL